MKGLTTSQAFDFLNKYGQNVISEPPKKSLLIKFFEQFNDFLTYLLIFAAFFSFLIRENVDGTLILAIVILNALFGIYQEAKAEESLQALKKMTVTRVRVIRDGVEAEIDGKFLVPGDCVYLEEGIKIPADGKILKSINMEINESALTGESLPVTKAVSDEVFSGTIIARGRGYMEVTATGDHTKFGQIAMNLSTIKDEDTPLKKKLADLTRFIGIGGIILAVLVFVISIIEGTGYFPSFLLSVSLAVAVVPEGLPAVMTITMAIGMKKMAGKKAVMRKLSAIEALGSITMIATDKTGTLTANKMQVKELFVDGKNTAAGKLSENESYDLEKGLSGQNARNLLILNGIVCSTASLVFTHEKKHWDVLGDPTEGALLYLAQNHRVDIETVRGEWKLLDERPFDSVTKKMSVLATNGRKTIVLAKGAPESILAVCDKYLSGGRELGLDASEKKKINSQVTAWANHGLRVLAMAYRNGKKIDDGNLVFIGMVAIHDAVRPEVKLSVAKAHRAGIKVVMITGDNEKTAEAIGVECGLLVQGQEILTGAQVEKYSDEELLQILPKTAIFARTNPFQKHRIVKLYQKLGEIVAVTGDGVNDAIALKQADVGVAMGLVGTDVARETADMIITDDNFATIVTAIEEGRGIINNIKNAIKYLLSCNVSEAVALVIGLILGLPTLFYPIQLLYINLVTDGLPALMLSFSPRNPNLMEITPQKEMVLLKKKDQYYIFFIGGVGSLLVILSFFIFRNYPGANIGGTAAFSILTLIQSFIFIDLWLSHRHIHESFGHLASPLFFLAFSIPIILQFIILSHPLSASIFKSSPVTPLVFLEFLGISFLILGAIRVIKKLAKM